MLSDGMLSVMLSDVMRSAMMLSDVMLSAVMLSAVMLSAVILTWKPDLLCGGTSGSHLTPFFIFRVTYTNIRQYHSTATS